MIMYENVPLGEVCNKAFIKSHDISFQLGNKGFLCLTDGKRTFETGFTDHNINIFIKDALGL